MSKPSECVHCKCALTQRQSTVSPLFSSHLSVRLDMNKTLQAAWVLLSPVVEVQSTLLYMHAVLVFLSYLTFVEVSLWEFQSRLSTVFNTSRVTVTVFCKFLICHGSNSGLTFVNCFDWVHLQAKLTNISRFRLLKCQIAFLSCIMINNAFAFYKLQFVGQNKSFEDVSLSSIIKVFWHFVEMTEVSNVHVISCNSVWDTNTCQTEAGNIYLAII